MERDMVGWHRGEGLRFPIGRWELMLSGALMRQTGARREFALVYDGTVPFPLTELFCFARWERIGGRQYIIYAFDEKNTPIF